MRILSVILLALLFAGCRTTPPNITAIATDYMVTDEPKDRELAGTKLLAAQRPPLPPAKYLGYVTVHKDPMRGQDWRCSRNLPKIDPYLSYGMRVSRAENETPTFDMRIDWRFARDEYALRNVSDKGKGLL
jgi:hypothetical protein